MGILHPLLLLLLAFLVSSTFQMHASHHKHKPNAALSGSLSSEQSHTRTLKAAQKQAGFQTRDQQTYISDVHEFHYIDGLSSYILGSLSLC